MAFRLFQITIIFNNSNTKSETTIKPNCCVRGGGLMNKLVDVMMMMMLMIMNGWSCDACWCWCVVMVNNKDGVRVRISVVDWQVTSETPESRMMVEWNEETECETTEERCTLQLQLHWKRIKNPKHRMWNHCTAIPFASDTVLRKKNSRKILICFIFSKKLQTVIYTLDLTLASHLLCKCKRRNSSHQSIDLVKYEISSAIRSNCQQNA
jgi:hypothetical protein